LVCVTAEKIKVSPRRQYDLLTAAISQYTFIFPSFWNIKLLDGKISPEIYLFGFSVVI
jgi:hypothetical protein